MSVSMWADEKSPSWWGIWYGLSHCERCHALSKELSCPKCGHVHEQKSHVLIVDGVEHIVPSASQGAISWSTNVLLKLMQREWERPASEDDTFAHYPPEKRPSQKIIIVILFWTLFEHLMDRFYAAAMSSLPTGVGGDLLRRYASIGSRLDRLYRILFDTTFSGDLAKLGYGSVFVHLTNVQQKRNELVHGNVEVIDDGIVYETVAQLHNVQEAWVALFNLRCAGNPSAPQIWEG